MTETDEPEEREEPSGSRMWCGMVMEALYQEEHKAPPPQPSLGDDTDFGRQMH